MRKSIILIVGLVGAVNLQCADRGEDSKSAVPASTSPREQYVQIKSIKDLETFTKSVVAFRGDDWVDEYGGAVHDHDHVDRRYSLKLDGDHFAYLDGCTFELAPRFSGEGAVTLSDGRLQESPLSLRKVTPQEARNILDKMNFDQVRFGECRPDILDSLRKTKGF